MNQKEVLIISITIFVTVVIWIVADLYHTATSQKVKETNPRFSKPIDVKVPVEVFTILEERQ